MPAKLSPPEAPLSRGWPSRVRSAILHVISPGQFTKAYVRGWPSPIKRPGTKHSIGGWLDSVQRSAAGNLAPVFRHRQERLKYASAGAIRADWLNRGRNWPKFPTFDGSRDGVGTNAGSAVPVELRPTFEFEGIATPPVVSVFALGSNDRPCLHRWSYDGNCGNHLLADAIGRGLTPPPVSDCGCFALQSNFDFDIIRWSELNIAIDPPLGGLGNGLQIWVLFCCPRSCRVLGCRRFRPVQGAIRGPDSAKRRQGHCSRRHQDS